MMKTITMADLRACTESAKRRIGWTDDAAAMAALRNQGDRRTEVKRVLLARIDEPARGAGMEPIPARY